MGLESRLREEQKEPCKKRAKKQKHRHISSGGDEGEASGDRHQSDMKGLKKRRKEKNPDGSDKDQRRRKRKKTKHRSDNPQEATTVVQSVEEGPSTNGNRSESVQSLEKRRESPSGSAAMLKRDASPARKEEWAKVGDRELALIRPPYPRRFYVEHPDIASMGEEEVQRLRNELGVSCDAPQYKPLREMWHAGFPETVAKALESFEKPSPIQAQAWPVALSGEDMIGIAATGSGKTLAFGLPALVQALAQGETNPKRPKALVMSPTRELAQQTAGVMAEAGEPSNVRAACVHGGEKKQKQRKELAKGGGCSLVVATPGRLVDLVESGEMALDRVTYFVLDEADRMLDLGFEEAMRSIGGRVRADRQTLMFSATWPERIRALASEFLANPIAVWVGGKQLKASHSVRQIVEVVKPHEKEEALDSLLQQYHAPERARVLVFALYKREAADLERALKCASSPFFLLLLLHGVFLSRDHGIQSLSSQTARVGVQEHPWGHGPARAVSSRCCIQRGRGSASHRHRRCRQGVGHPGR